MSDLHALGHAGSDSYVGMEVIRLDTEMSEVIFSSDEFTAVCPVTGQPDQYELDIKLTKTDVTLESKSLKIYLGSFRNKGAFCENLATEIEQDVIQAVDEADKGQFLEIEVRIVQKRRGGIQIEATT